MTVTLYLLEAKNYFKGLLALAKRQSADNLVIWLTLTRPFVQLRDALDFAGIPPKRIFFIDASSGPVPRGAQPTENCIFIESPQDIVGMTIAISETLSLTHGKRVLLVDSLNTLLAFQSSDIVEQFTNVLANKARTLGIDVAFLASDVGSKKLGSIEALVDEVKE
ncbi:hypothetical protein HY493_00730 [Candidatus Woesearchaeota archaeon]|nr:hypothetical protein [Candidatus Woesearchaeota archaeon]